MEPERYAHSRNRSPESKAPAGRHVYRTSANQFPQAPAGGDMCVDWGRHQKSSSIYGSFMNLRYANTGDSATVKDREFR